MTAAAEPPQAPERLTIAVGILRNGAGEVLVALRPAGAHQGERWEFPGGKLEPGETVAQALRREFEEELGVKVLASIPLLQVRHDYGDRRVLLDVREVTDSRGEAHGREGQPLEWLSPDALWQRRMPAANDAILRALMLAPVLAISGRVEANFEQRIARVLARGAKLLQLRLADELSADQAAALAAPVLAQCRDTGARVLANTSPELALALGMDGVHLNRHRLLAAQQRPFGTHADGRRLLVGASCHDGVELRHAVAIRADYALLSPVLPTASHPGEPTLGWPLFEQLSAANPLPVYALGGMQADSLDDARSHGAYGIALLGALWNE